MSPRVLIVDGDAGALATAQNWLEEAEYETTAATTFLEGKAALRADAFDVLVADVRLEAYNGLHLVLLAKLRSPQTRTIVTDASWSGSLESEARRAGTDVCLPKPVTRWNLLSAVAAALHANEGGQAVPRRWPRVKLDRCREGMVANALARILDVSYGGVRMELAAARERDLRSVVRLDMVEPELSVRVRPVWTRQSPGKGGWLCGAELADHDPSVTAIWRTLVDSLQVALA